MKKGVSELHSAVGKYLPTFESDESSDSEESDYSEHMPLSSMQSIQQFAWDGSDTGGDEKKDR
eukprot:UN00212